MTNIRFRELSPGITVELIATRIEFNYAPAEQGELRAVWWAQEYLPIGDSYQRLGDAGTCMTTVLSEHATTKLTITDPVTQEEVVLSAAGAVTWLKAWFDYQYNLENIIEEEKIDDPS